MTKAEKYIKERPDYQMHLVDKKFGNGKLLIEFFYRDQVRRFKQGFLAYVDNQKWIKSSCDVMNEVQDYLIENEGVIDVSDFAYDIECNDCIQISDMPYCEKHEADYKVWEKNQFPKIDLEYGGVCHFDIANF